MNVQGISAMLVPFSSCIEIHHDVLSLCFIVRDGKVRKSVERIFSIWEERSVYPEEVIAQLKGSLNKKEKEREKQKEREKEKGKEKGKEKETSPANGQFWLRRRHFLK